MSQIFRDNNQKFSRPEWLIANRNIMASAENKRIKAERLGDVVSVVLDDVEQMSAKVENEVDHKFEERLKDIDHWEEELNLKLCHIKQEIDELESMDTIMIKAVESVSEPMHIARECLIIRQKRPGIDLVHDQAEKELLKELEVYEGVLNLYRSSQEQLREQLRLARKMKYLLEKDLTNKEQAVFIDKQNLQLKSNFVDNSRNTLMFHMEDPTCKRSSSVQEWQKFSESNIVGSEKVLKNCVNLKIVITSLLQQTADDMKRQINETDFQLKLRIDETRNAKGKLEGHLAKVKKQILETEEKQSQLQLAIESQQGPTQLAQTRLSNRKIRPEIEECLDPVEMSLSRELVFIGKSSESLKILFSECQRSLIGLRAKQLELEEDIMRKSEAIKCDEKECVTLRKSLLVIPQLI